METYREEKYEDEPKTEWVPLAFASIIALFTCIQFTIYFASLWPYLLQLDSSSSEEFFGGIIAVYSLCQALMCPLFGWWTGKINQCKIPILTGLILMMIGNILYLFCENSSIAPKWVMFISRAFTGLGAGVITVLRTYSVNASTEKDRSRAIALNSGSFAMGLVIGPAIQIIFTPLGYPGWNIFGFGVNMYTAPALLGTVMNAVCSFVVIMFFKESTVGLQKKVQTTNEEHTRFYALPRFDRVALIVCICTRFTQMIVFTNLETIGAPLAMTMFNWNRQETVKYNSLMHGGFGFISFIFYSINVYFDLGKKINHRIATMIGCVGLFVYHILTYPWWFLPGKISYQELYIEVNGTMVENPDPVGCRPAFDWCAYIPPINEAVYVYGYIIIVGLSFSLISVSMNTVFSTVLGPRNQGFWQGIMEVSASVARMCGPIFVSSLFTMFGPRSAWNMELILSGGCALLWIIWYKRLVPLKLPQNFIAGDSFKNKHGSVYKF